MSDAEKALSDLLSWLAVDDETDADDMASALGVEDHGQLWALIQRATAALSK